MTLPSSFDLFIHVQTFFFFSNPWGTSSEISKTRGFLKFSGGIGFLMFSWGIEQDHWQKCVNKSSWRRSLREFVAESAPAFIPICVIISIFQYFEECEHLQEMGRVNVENPQLSQRLATIIFWTFRSFYQKKKKKNFVSFLRMGFNWLKARATSRSHYHYVPRNFWYLSGPLLRLQP